MIIFSFVSKDVMLETLEPLVLIDLLRQRSSSSS